jgi:alpha-beta hydrolase superfamily lysophospholipase
LWSPEKAWGTILLIHGLGEHSGRYGHVAERLATSGLSVFSFDLRGHGLSRGGRGNLRSYGDFLEDVAVMEGVWRKECPEEKARFLLGHSLGGLVALSYLRERRSDFQGAVFSAPWLRAAQPPWLRALGRVMGTVFPALPLPSGLGPGRLTRDHEMAAAWRADPLIHPRLLGRLLRLVEEVQRKLLEEEREWWGPPALFLVPGDDPVVDSRVTEDFARGFTEEEVQVEILEGRRHEAFNDLGREEVFDLLARWMARVGVVKEERERPPGPQK